jgi:DNA-binding Lrp family transcriptional regulator
MGMTAAAGSDWRKLGSSDDFYAAFVFMDEARRSRYGDVSPTNTPAFATKMANASDADLVFAHALVGPSDLLIGVRAKSFKELVETVQTKIQPYVDEGHFVHKLQSHIIISIEGRIDFTKDAFDGEKRSIPAMRAWVLATAGSRPQGATSDPCGKPLSDALGLEAEIGENEHVKLIAKVIGGYDYFIYVEAEKMKEMQSVVDRWIRNRREFIATDTRIVMDED